MNSSDQNSNCTFAHDYPNSNIITTTYHENNRKTHLRKHIIHSLGVYPSNIKKMKKSSKNCPEYEIPDNYKVETTLEGYKIVCETNYLLDGTVKFTLNWKDSQAKDMEKESQIILKKQNFDNTKIRYIELKVGGDEVIGIDLSK
ncbi:8925_t:CDS:2, partial [Rhizophagus irregularis]